VLPDWPAGTVTILATAGDSPHAIPVSAAVRAGPRRVLIALAAARGSLERLRADPRVSLTIICEDTAVTAYGRARALDDHADHADHAIHATHADGPLPAGVVPVEIDVDRVEDHDRPTFEIESGVRWRWTDPDAERRDADVRAGLARLAGLGGRADGAQPS
jgi:hypothetical protein